MRLSSGLPLRALRALHMAGPLHPDSIRTSIHVTRPPSTTLGGPGVVTEAEAEVPLT